MPVFFQYDYKPSTTIIDYITYSESKIFYLQLNETIYSNLDWFFYVGLTIRNIQFELCFWCNAGFRGYVKSPEILKGYNLSFLFQSKKCHAAFRLLFYRAGRRYKYHPMLKLGADHWSDTMSWKLIACYFLVNEAINNKTDFGSDFSLVKNVLFLLHKWYNS